MRGKVLEAEDGMEKKGFTAMQASGWIRTRAVLILVTFAGSSRPSSGRLAGVPIRQNRNCFASKSHSKTDTVRRLQSRSGFALKGDSKVERASH